MKINNIMEDIISGQVTEIFDDEEQTKRKGFCTCYQCRLDVTCYVLNRIAPQYVISGRGMTRLNSEYTSDLQKQADIVALIKEGINTVSTAKRPNFRHNNVKDSPFIEGLVFNFPTIVGRLFHGKTFEPLLDIPVALRRDDEMVDMIDPGWDNPCYLTSAAPGQFIFWPYPVKAEKEGDVQSFSFEIFTDVPGYEPLQHFFDVSVPASEKVIDSCHITETKKLEDLYIFPLND